jgi:hypothetical protein
MWVELILILVVVVFALSVKEGYQAGDYRADMFASNECPCLKCVDKTKF